MKWTQRFSPLLFFKWLCTQMRPVAKIQENKWHVVTYIIYLCAFSYCSWRSKGKNAEVLCHSLFQWTTFWKNWCWSWSSNTLATWCKKPAHWKRSWCWERLRAGGEGDNRGWNGWVALSTQWTWVWAKSETVKDRESWHAEVHGVAESDTTEWLNNNSLCRLQHFIYGHSQYLHTSTLTDW